MRNGKDVSHQWKGFPPLDDIWIWYTKPAFVSWCCTATDVLPLTLSQKVWAQVKVWENGFKQLLELHKHLLLFMLMTFCLVLLFLNEMHSPLIMGSIPGAHTKPLSKSLGSNWVTHRATRSPWMAELTGLRNICMDLTLRVICSDGTSTFWKQWYIRFPDDFK